jgi:hypothetical protein
MVSQVISVPTRSMIDPLDLSFICHNYLLCLYTISMATIISSIDNAPQTI